MSTRLKTTHKPPTADPLPEGWTEHKAPTGHAYYYNTSTGQSTYTRPTAAVPASTIDTSVAPGAVSHPQAGTNGLSHGPWNAPFSSDQSLSHPARPEQHRRPEPKDRPKSKKTIPGAKPWLLVYTRLGRRFVHNPESNESLWKFPSDVLKCVVELDRKQRERKERRERGEASESEHETETAAQSKDYDSDEYEEVEVTDDEDGNAVPKRPRLQEDEQPPPGPREFNEDDIAYQLAAMEAGDDGYEQEMDWDDHEEPPLDESDAKALFFDLLDDYQINPYTPWESIIESGQIIDDERYTCLPNMKSRREAFEAWSVDRMQKLKEAKAKQEKKDPKIPYLAFLQQHATPKLYWPEFKRKYRKEPEMRDSKFSDKDREKLYREHINRLKMPESTLKADLTNLLRSLPLKDVNRSSSMSMLPPSLITDIRYISLSESVRDPLIEGYIAMQPAAPEPTNESPEEDAELAKQRAEREKREQALKDRERRVDEERRRREIALRASKSAAMADKAEVEQAMRIGRSGLMGHLESASEDRAEES